MSRQQTVFLKSYIKNWELVINMICDKELFNLIESIGDDTSTKNLKLHLEQINKITKHFKETRLYQNSKKQREEYADGQDAEECYNDMIVKIAISPLRLFADGAVILILPIIAEKLNSTTIIEVK